MQASSSPLAFNRLNQTSRVGYDFGFTLGMSIAISGRGVGGGAFSPPDVEGAMTADD